MYNSNQSRREFIRYLGYATIGISMGQSFAGCVNQKPEHKHLRFYGTGTLDIMDDGWSVANKEIGTRISFIDNGNDTGPVIAQMIAGTASTDYNLGGLQGGAERELAKAGVILPWNLNKIPNWNKMWTMAIDIPYTRVDNEQFGIPIALNADSMIYLPDKIKTVPGYESGLIDTYFAVFDEKLRGKVSMEDAWINSVIFTAIYLKENGLCAINDPGNLTETELKEVMTFLIKLKKAGHFRKFWRGWEQGVDLLRSGEVWVMTGWEPIVYELQRQKINAVYAKPKEGYEGWSNDLLLHAGTKDKGLVNIAHEFANWLLGGYYGCKLAMLRGYAVPNDNMITYANNSLDFDIKKIQSLSKHVKDKFKIEGGNAHWQNVRPENYRFYEEWWSRLRNV